jgi:6-pyruvoyl tetrahydropterin synthase/QueD family protein
VLTFDSTVKVSFTVRVNGTELRFSSAHFIYSEEFREPLHGHNYDVEAEAFGELGQDGFVINFLEFKEIVKSLIKPLDHKFLLPVKNPLIKLQNRKSGSGNSLRLICKYGEEYVFPSNDVSLLPIVNVSTEELAQYLIHKLALTLENRKNIYNVTIKIHETSNNTAEKTEKLNKPR